MTRLSGFSWGTAEEPVEPAVRHGQTLAVIEVLHVEPQRPVLSQVDQLIQNFPRVSGFAVRRQAHDLVFARIDLESRVVGERRIEQAERVGKMQLGFEMDLVAFAIAVGGRRPFPDAVDGQNRRGIKRRREESTGGVRLVVLRENELPGTSACGGDVIAHPQLFAKPQRHRLQEGAKA